jgi:serine protease Do
MNTKLAKERKWLAIGAAALIFLLAAVVSAQVSERASDPGRETKPQRASLAQSPDFVALANKLGPMVVNISTTQVVKERGDPSPGLPGGDDPLREFWRRFFGDPSFQGPFRRQGLGSGVIIDRDGTILTNNHVVENAEKIMVKLQDEREFEGKVLGRDAKTDIAVVKIDAKGDLPVAPLGNSDRLEVGEWIVAMGSPFGLNNTITAGIVSAKGRHIGAGPYDNFIQTDASINPGNSGGPLINLGGEVVGINTAIFSQSGGNVGIGFAIPINLVKELLPELKAKGKVTRGWLGVSIQRMTPEIAEGFGMEKARGALVATVIEGSPADEAGIETGDVIIEYNGQRIEESNQLPILVARTDVGKSAKLTVMRDNKQIPITVKIGELKEEEVVASSPQSGKLGLTVQNVTPEIAESLGLDGAAGVVVTAVQPQSVASEAGLRRSDVILEINRRRIANVGDFQKTVNETKPGENLLFLIRRGGNNLFLALKSPEAKG